MIRPTGLFILFLALWGLANAADVSEDLVFKERGQQAPGRILSRDDDNHGSIRFEFFVKGRRVVSDRARSSWAKDPLVVTYDPTDPRVNTIGFYPERARDTVLWTFFDSIVVAAVGEIILRWASRLRANTAPEENHS